MTTIATVSLTLPEPVELPCLFGRLTRMRATSVEVYNSAIFDYITILHGPGIRKDGTDAVNKSDFRVTESENGKLFHLIPEADWAVIRRAQDMVQAMMDAAREVEEAAS
mgnify:CR=1 FL=1